MRMVINRWHMSVKYKVIATSVDRQEKESEKATNSKKKRKRRNLSGMERIERQESEYVGVSWSKSAQQWVSQIRVNKKVKRLGYFDSDKGAAMKYDEEARKHGRPVNVPIHPADIQAEKQNKG